MDKQELVDFMITKLGGERAVLGEYYGYRLTELAMEQKTIEEVVAEATEGGWIDFFHSMKLTDLMAALIPDGKPKLKRGRPRRLTPEDYERLDARIVAYLTANPWSSRPAIIEAVGEPLTRTARRIKMLLDAGTIKRKGKKTATRFAIAEEEDRAAPNKPKKPKGRAKGKLLARPDAATYCGISKSTLAYHIARDQGPHHRGKTIGRSDAYYVSDLDAWIADGPLRHKPKKKRRKKK